MSPRAEANRTKSFGADPKRSDLSPFTIVFAATAGLRAANDNEPPPSKTPTLVRLLLGSVAQLFATATVAVVISHHIPTATNDNAPPAKVPTSAAGPNGQPMTTRRLCNIKRASSLAARVSSSA
jgi:hypothetical protein